MALLLAFNGKITFADGGKYTRAEILGLFDRIVADPAGYGVDAGSSPYLANVVVDIKACMPTRPQDFGKVVLTTPRVLNYQTTQFTMYTLLDLVGWITSVSGAAPNNATRDNYFYPLCGLYAYFCRTLLGAKKREAQMIQLTLFQQGATRRAVLGANLDNPPDDSKRVIQEARNVQMVAKGLIVQNQASEVDQAGNALPQKFGHCAETFTFMFVKSLGLNEAAMGAAEGFALQPFIVLEKTAGVPYVFDKTKTLEGLAPPCPNCVTLMEKLKFTRQNFEKPA